MDLENRTGWVQSGATTGESYYEIGKTTKSLAFRAGTHPTVGVRGQFSGGGYVTLLRKYSLASDNVIDALVVDARGRILDRQAMGEEYFWAICGGGGSSFAVIRLVDVPSMVTVFKVKKTSESEAVPMINKWQYVAVIIPNDLYIRASFSGHYIGPVNDLLAVMEEKFLILGLEGIDDIVQEPIPEAAVHELWRRGPRLVLQRSF
ncbi:unnamed protein product [Thlaspi arvense]|uniref:FAD-binding PCMH-type domain-containing protein n=1 Tax=Thlaspi arvense TaxID=13288 RepID=A0AAU9RRZ7_THLAR|nr:unnamed protein product [Thlaspi arvense]